MICSRFCLPFACLLLVGTTFVLSRSASTNSSPETDDTRQTSLASAKTTGSDLTSAAVAFLDTLSADQKKTGVFEYGAKERTQWHFIPKDSRKGIQYKSMSPEQKTAAKKLLTVSLSKSGLAKAETIMKLEGLLNAIEKGRGAIRDPERYYYTLFGKPSESGKWGLSIEGHHLSLNMVVENNEIVSVSPSFFAANPGIVKTDIHPPIKKGTRVLAMEEKLAFELVNSLEEKQKQSAIFAKKAPKEIRAAGEPQPPNEKPIGLAASDLTGSQLEMLERLIKTYSGNFPTDVEKQKLDEIKKAGIDQVHFAWGGATKPGIGHYYRVQGPTFLIEFVNTQPDAEGNPANHIHCVWRNPKGDFAIEITK